MTALEELTLLLSQAKLADRRHRTFCLVAMARPEAAAFGDTCETCTDLSGRVREIEQRIAELSNPPTGGVVPC